MADAMSLIPTIRQLQSQGMSSQQIMQQLQRDGTPTAEIASAMEMANQQNQFGQPMPPPPNMGSQSNPMSMQPQGLGGSMIPPPGAGMSDEIHEIEELIEQVVEEKWNIALKKINELQDFKAQTEQRFIELKTQLTDLQSQFKTLEQSVIGRVGEYDKNVGQVNTNLQAMEMAFSKILPQFTDNVQQLNEITKRVKK